ncbi:MAG TPA: hypothetical protein VF598_07825, partial [Hymenobacter sp.]
IGEQAYWAAKDGVVHSELFRGLWQAEIKQLVYHWLFVWQAAGVIKLVGWSLLALRLISLSYLGVFLITSYRHLSSYFFTRASTCYLFYALLLTNTLVVEYGYVFRPEIMLMCLGFGSWVFLQRSLHGATSSARRNAVAAGLLAGIAALAHLNGLIYVVAGAGLLLCKRRISPLLVFTAVAGGVFSIYFLEIMLHNSWQTYAAQMSPALQEESARFLTYILYILSEHERFFHSPIEIVLSLLVLASGYVLYKARYRNARFAEAVLYLLLLMAALACIAQSKTTKYLLLYMPHLCLVIAVAFEHLPRPQAWLPRLLNGLLIIYVAVNFGYTGYLISKHEDRPAKNQALAQQLAAYPHAQIVAPLNFIFPEILDFTIQGVTCYQVLMETHQIPSGEAGFFSEATRFQRQLIIMDDSSLKGLGLQKPVVGRRYGKYFCAYRFHDFYVYQAL